MTVLATLAIGSLWEMQRLQTTSSWAMHTRDVMAEGGRVLQHAFDEPGPHVLTALADSGAWDSLRFTILE